MLLIVDDEPSVQLLLAEMLSELGSEIVTASSVAEGRAALERIGAALEVALVDKNLPDGSGLAVIAAAKHSVPDCAPILITGYASLESAIEAISIGAYDYIQKPFEDIHALALKVKNARDKVRIDRERRQLDESLKESEARYRQLFEASSDALLVTDPHEGAIIAANAAAARLFAGPFDGVTISELLATARFAAEVTQTTMPLGGAQAIVYTVRDISERVRAEEIHRGLEQQLARAQKMEAIGRIAGGVAHDYNNMLCVVQNCATFVSRYLRESSAPVQVREDIQTVISTGQSAIALSRQLLAFARTQATMKEPIEINRAILQLRPMLTHAVGKKVELAFELGAELAPVVLGSGQVEQLLANLVLNARDAIDSDGRIVVSTRALAAHEQVEGTRGALDVPSVLLTVSDNGAGIDPSLIEHVFQPFFTTKGPHGGTGLGLATVARIVEQAAGSIDVASEPQAGTRFLIRLPTGTVGARPSPASPIVSEQRAAVAAGELVLVVEDDEAMRTMTSRMLREAGYRVIVARDPSDAMLRFVENKDALALVVTDLVMPQMSGIELIARLRRQRAALGAVFMSGHAAEALTSEGVIPDGVSILSKPFSEEGLARAVADAIRQGKP